jgi:hypothetical protein
MCIVQKSYDSRAANTQTFPLQTSSAPKNVARKQLLHTNPGTILYIVGSFKSTDRK